MVFNDQEKQDIDEIIVTENIPQFMTINEVAKRLKVSRSTIIRYIDREENPLPVVYFSDRVPRVPWDQFNLWVDSQLDKKGGE